MPLCKRIIGCVLIDNGLVVRRERESTTSIIGKPEITIRYLQDWEIDEIMFINVGNKIDMVPILEYACNKCFIPITVGGSIGSLEEIKRYFNAGADKVVIGKHATLGLIQEVSQVYGNQALCISIDKDHKKRLEEIKDWPIGEVIMHDIERDGVGDGLNLDILNYESSFPQIAMGGVGDYSHIVEGLENADAVAVGNLFSFKEQAARMAKEEAINKGIVIRPIMI